MLIYSTDVSERVRTAITGGQAKGCPPKFFAIVAPQDETIPVNLSRRGGGDDDSSREMIILTLLTSDASRERKKNKEMGLAIDMRYVLMISDILIDKNLEHLI